VDEAGEEIRVGLHLFRHEPPGIVLWRLVGDVSEAEMRRLCDEVDAIVGDKDYILMLIDMSSVGTLTPGARKASVEDRGPKARGAAIFGASTPLRILSNFVIRAAGRMLTRNDTPTRFFSTEPEAREWLAERRRVVLQERR
jgi:hypothetical protein